MGNSSSTPSSTTTTYDVFLSFRGTDTRKSFTSHLYRALDEKGISTFIDDKLVRGEEISDGLWRAIGKSKISVIIFSENYAFSRWCLRELAEIMKYKGMKKQIVIPVFYKVDPSHVRKQIGSYKAAFAKHENEGSVSFCFLLLFSSLAAVFSCFFFGWLRLCLLFLFFWGGVLGTLCLYPVFCCCLWASLPPIIYMADQKKEEKVQEWRGALTLASNLSGWDSSVARNESELVCNIVGDVWNKLYNISPSCDFEDLVKDYVGIEKYVGIDKHIVRVVSLLSVEMQDFRIIGIWGMGGMGKTTIADVVFHIISHQFENRTYFTSSVREKDSTGLTSLRNKILSKVLKIENIENQISDSPNIPQRFKKMLLQIKVLIVFDDVDSIEQLETLAGDLDRLGPGSRIIVTTRDKQVLRTCGVKDHKMHEVKGLNPDEALQLFCNHAFKQNHSKKDFEDLTRKLLKIATDVPLAIRVLGSLLYEKSKQYWEDAVGQFQEIKDPTIFDRLKISYNGLGEEEKGLFLDIACFVDVFAFGRDLVGIRPKLLSNRMCFLDHLIDKSLVTVECGYIKMHDLLREMGMKIASENRSRLYRQEDVLHTLEHNDGTDAVHGIFLNMFNLKDVSFQALMKMNNLTTLIITGGQNYHCYGGLDYLPNKLRYLHWKSYPLEVLPSSVNPENLVELDLSYSKIKQLWEGSTWVPKLKWLNLYHCEKLISIPDLSNIPSAEIINLKDCSSLIEIHSSRECPKNLHSLQLKACQSLSSFPSKIHLSEEPSFIPSVILHSRREGSEFSLGYCRSLTIFPHISGNIKRLDLSASGVEEVPSTIESLSKLESLDMSDCERLKSISESICKLKSLVRLDLSGCYELESFPDILEGMELKYLNLRDTAIKELPPSIGNLNWLEELLLSGCENLETFPSSIWKSLVRLDLNGCCKLESFPDILEGMELKYLNLRGTAIKELPPSIGNLNRLEELVLSDYISELNLYGRSKLEKLPPLSGLFSLKKLRLNNSSLTEISEDIGCLSSLEELELDGNVFERLPKSIKQLSKLCYLSVNNCGMLQSLPELPSSLLYLEAKNCKELFQSLLDESEFEFCPDGSGSFYFNFLNCLELNQKAVSNLLIFFQDSQLKLQDTGTEKIISLFTSQLPPKHLYSLQTPEEEVKGTICLPGSEIPECLGCYTNIGSSINNIPMLRNDCARSRYIMGFEVYLVIGAEGYNDDLMYDLASGIDVCYDFLIESSDGHKTGLFCNSIRLAGIPVNGSNHILLGYNLSRKCYELFQDLDTRLANHGMSDYVGSSFEFSIRIIDLYGGFSNLPSCFEVKYCGIQPIYVPFIDFVFINQDIGETSGCNDIAEETCEPHPKRICTEANQCSTTHGL